MVFDWLRRRGKKKTEGAVYHLVFQPKGTAGWRPVEKFGYPVEQEEAMAFMVNAGTYHLQERVHGKIMGYAWKQPYIIEGKRAKREDEESIPGRTESDRVAEAIETDMVRAVRWMKLPVMISAAMQQAMGGEEAMKGLMGGGGTVGLQIPEGMTLEEYLDDLEQKRFDRFKNMAERHGYVPKGSTSGEAFPEYEGKLPIWMHPKGVPEMIDQGMEKVERRLEKWKLIPSGKKSVGKEESVFEMPPRPESSAKTAELEAIEEQEKEETEGEPESERSAD